MSRQTWPADTSSPARERSREERGEDKTGKWDRAELTSTPTPTDSPCEGVRVCERGGGKVIHCKHQPITADLFPKLQPQRWVCKS